MTARLPALLAILLASHACAQGGGDDAPAAAAGSQPLRIGMNLGPVAPFSGQQPFVDRAKTMQWTADWQPMPAQDLDAAGFPARVPAGRTQVTSSTTLDPVPRRYVLLYEGSPAVNVYDKATAGRNVLGWGGGVAINSWKPGRIEFTSAGATNWAIAGFDRAAPFRNVHIVRADQEAAWRAGAVINPDWLARFGRHFSPYRMMDWGCTNGSGQVRWADRPRPEASAWGCVPYETMIALANASDADLWLNVPHMADDDYVRRLATLVRDRLAPGLKLHLEYSNEVWNAQFEQSRWAQAQADRLWGNGAAVPFGNEVWYGYRAAQVMRIAGGVLGARLRGVVATFPNWGNGDMDDAIAEGVRKAGAGPVSGLFREYATTTYFGNQLSYSIGNEPDRPVSLGWAQGGPAGLDAAFAELERGGAMKTDNSLAALRKGYRRHAAQARAWGLDLVAYEGGFHIYLFMSPENERSARLDLLNRMLADPRMGRAYARMAEDFRAAGGTVLATFNDVGPAGIFGAWGVIPDLAATTPRYEALRAAGRR